jgi:hypothetical protein
MRAARPSRPDSNAMSVIRSLSVVAKCPGLGRQRPVRIQMVALIGLHRHDGRMPYSAWTALTWDESPVLRAAHKAPNYLSSPPGVLMSSPRAVPPTLLNVCGL